MTRQAENGQLWQTEPMAICSRLRAFSTSIFTEMTELALRHDAINLGQGFPDFEGPEELKETVVEAIRSGRNQYCRSAGLPELVEAVARHQAEHYQLEYDPLAEITITCGATEALFATFQGLLEPGDEVIVLQPFYDAYPAGVAAAGGVVRPVTLPGPDFRIDAEALERAICERTRMIVVNTPHNPLGRVFDADELGAVAALCQRHDLIALSDEVYEHLVFTGEHLPLASLPGMAERTITISSLGKSFSFTGWKVGWACAPPELTAAIRAAHQFVTFCTPAPFQLAAAHALGLGEAYFQPFLAAYQSRCDVICDGLTTAGFDVMRPQGTYFVLADIRSLGYDDDIAFCRMLPAEVGVAAIPTSVFHVDPGSNRHYVRFAFSKHRSALEQALERLTTLTSADTSGSSATGRAAKGSA